MEIKTLKAGPWIRTTFFAFTICIVACTIGCQNQTNNKKPKTDGMGSTADIIKTTPDPTQVTETKLFDGKSLDGWRQTDFGGQVEAIVIDGEIVIEAGSPMAGINRNRDEDLPKSNYEISLEAKRTAGIDFFCGLTFPVHESFCTLIVAGWAGATVGLSNVDGLDASSNDTSLVMDLKDNRWYKIKVRVTDDAITCWIDDEQVIVQKLAGHKISIRPDVTPCLPLGLCAFESAVAYRNLVMKQTDVGK